MRSIIWLDSAVNDIVRLRSFIAKHNSSAAQKAASIIKKAVNQLTTFPNMGKPVTDLSDYRDLPIKFGAAGYILRYRVQENIVYIVHIRHYREATFKSEVPEILEI